MNGKESWSAIPKRTRVAHGGRIARNRARRLTSLQLRASNDRLPQIAGLTDKARSDLLFSMFGASPQGLIADVRQRLASRDGRDLDKKSGSDSVRLVGGFLCIISLLLLFSSLGACCFWVTAKLRLLLSMEHWANRTGPLSSRSIPGTPPDRLFTTQSGDS